jgi:spore germination protein KB
MREKITAHQFLSIMILIPFGSAVLFFLVPDEKQNIWIALLLYSAFDLILQFIYTNLYKNFPGDTPVTYMPKIYGKILGSCISMAYILYFLYLSGRVLRDFLELIQSFTLPRTPIILTGILLTLTVTYGVYKGLENLGSLSEIFIIIILLSLAILWLLTFITGGILKTEHLFPLLEDGLLPVIKNGYSLLSFPYGEFIVTTMFYPYVLQQNKIRKACFLGCISEGIILAINNILFIVTLGVFFASVNNFPLLESLRLVHIGEFISRLDILFIVLLLECGFFKISLTLYASILGAVQLFNINKHWGLLCILFGILMLITSMSIATNYPEHIKIGLDIAINTINLPIQIYIPTFTFLFLNFKKLLHLKKNT